MKANTASKSKEWPKTIRHGNASVKLYKVKSGDYTLYTLAWRGADGKRKLRQFADEKEAKEEADAAARRLHEGELQVLQLRDADKHVYVEALKMIQPTGKRLDMVAREYADAFKILNGASLVEAARHYRKQTDDVKKITVGKAFEQFMAYVEKKGRSAVYLKDLRSRLGRFATAYQSSEVHTITATDMRQWLDTLIGSARTRDNARDLLITFFGYCQRNKFFPKGTLPTADIERFTDGDEGGEIQIFTPAEIRSLLAVATADVLAYLVLGAFAGIRTAELSRLEWQDIDLVSGYITIQGRKAKTRQRRLIRIQPNLSAWLALIKQPEGHVINLKRPDKTTYEVCAKQAGIIWKRNGLRHSFISYRLAATNDENLVSSEAGNSPAMVYRNYRQLVRPELATEWFSIAPAIAENVIPIARAEA